MPEIISAQLVSSLENELIGIWSEYLNTTGISLDDDFFLLGGNSLISAEIVIQIAKIFDIPLKDHILYENSTVRLLARSVYDQKYQHFNWIKHLQHRDSNKTPVYWFTQVPAILKHKLDTRGDVYFIDTHSHFAEFPSLLSTIPSFCNTICDQILQTSRSNKFILGGYSMGAVMALETAQQLTDRGMEVEVLFLLDPRDSTFPARYSNGMPDNKFTPAILASYLKWSYKSLKWLNRFMRNRLFLVYEQLTGKQAIEGIRRRCMHSGYVFQRMKYRFRPYDGKVILIRRNSNVLSKYSWTRLFRNETLTMYNLDNPSHFDYCYSEDSVDQWTTIFNREIKSLQDPV